MLAPQDIFLSCGISIDDSIKKWERLEYMTGYKIIELDTWPRKEHYLHFTKELNCTCCLTSNIDVALLVHGAKSAHRSLYICLLYCICKVINRHDEFKMSYQWQTDTLILWEEVGASHIVFHEKDETFTRIWSAWKEDFMAFYESCALDVARGKNISGYSVPNVPPNLFDVSCLPWITYTGMSLHIPENWIYLAPIITWGKFEEVNGKALLPLTMQIHHAVADGFHIARFFKEVEQVANDLALSL